MDKFKTAGGKEIETYSEGHSIKARFKGGGELPAILKGKWTSLTQAGNSIRAYLDSKVKPVNSKETVNAD